LSGAIGAATAAGAALEALGGGDPVCVVLCIEGAGAGRRLLCYASRTVGTLGDVVVDGLASEAALEALRTGERGLRRLEDEARTAVFLDPVSAPERLIVVGAGHIGVPVALLGQQLGFAVTLLDDRAEFADASRLPAGLAVRLVDFTADPFSGLPIDSHTYITLVTRGHAWDFDCLRLLFARDVEPRYIGMIGSRRRVRAAFTALLEAGIARERLAQLHAPIGLDIGAETPAEIAVSIAAELVQVRRGGSARPLTEREQVLSRLLPTGGVTG
jgi:xanthine dehydrogenase accessory factor